MSNAGPYVTRHQQKLADALNGGVRYGTFLVTIAMHADLPDDGQIASLLPELLTGGSFLAVDAEPVTKDSDS